VAIEVIDLDVLDEGHVLQRRHRLRGQVRRDRLDVVERQRHAPR
jgi:hypothetical protein